MRHLKPQINELVGYQGATQRRSLTGMHACCKKLGPMYWDISGDALAFFPPQGPDLGLTRLPFCLSHLCLHCGLCGEQWFYP